MIQTPNHGSDKSRTQPIVDALLKEAVSRSSKNRNVTEVVSIVRTPGCRGSSAQPIVYDFGNRYSVPATVVNGRIRRLDGKPYRG